MYQIYVDNKIFCDSRVDDLAIINPKVNLEVNKAGSFSFIIPPQHPYYDAITKRMSLIRVVRDEEELFEGICTSVSDDFYKQRTVECEGSLTFFNDTIQRPHKYQNMTVRGLLESFVANHNAKCEENKHFQVGIVTVMDSNDSIYCFTNYETTMECLKNDLVDDLGGFFRVRNSEGARYIDYLAESPNTATQAISLGDNLLDFDTTLDTTKIATVIIPLGATKETSSIEGLDERVGIASVNDGKDYVVSEDAVQNFGWIEKVVTWDNVTTPGALKSKAELYLSDTQFENMVIEAKAIDLHLAEESIESFKLLDKIHVISAPHGLDRYFVLTKRTINLNKPESDTITLGTVQKVALTAQNRNDNQDILHRIEKISISGILESAKDNAAQLIQNAGNGYISFSYDEDGHPYELLIMDKPTKEEATKVWRWNQNGLGYSSTGYNGEYGLAMTSTGEIVADFITTGEMKADRIKGGTLELGGYNDSLGMIKVYSGDGQLAGKWTQGRIESYYHSSIWGDAMMVWGEGSNYFYHEGFKAHLLTNNYVGTSGDDGNLDNIGIRTYYRCPKFRDIYTTISWDEIALYGGAQIRFWRTEDGRLVNSAILSPTSLYTRTVNARDSLICSGTKSRVVSTENYDKRLLYCYEMPTPMFGDIGAASTDEEGICYIYIDDILSETIDCEVEYQVFLQKYGEGDIYVADRQQNYFVVRGTPNIEFGWELKAIQRDYDSMRLETFEEEENEESEINNNNN